MSNQESNAILISAALKGLSEAQKQTNDYLKSIDDRMQEFIKISGEHDTKLVVHDMNITSIKENQAESENQIKAIKKKMAHLFFAMALSIIFSSAAIAETNGYNIPILNIIANLLKSL